MIIFDANRCSDWTRITVHFRRESVIILNADTHCTKCKAHIPRAVSALGAGSCPLCIQAAIQAVAPPPDVTVQMQAGQLPSPIAVVHGRVPAPRTILIVLGVLVLMVLFVSTQRNKIMEGSQAVPKPEVRSASTSPQNSNLQDYKAQLAEIQRYGIRQLQEVEHDSTVELQRISHLDAEAKLADSQAKILQMTSRYTDASDHLQYSGEKEMAAANALLRLGPLKSLRLAGVAYDIANKKIDLAQRFGMADDLRQAETERQRAIEQNNSALQNQQRAENMIKEADHVTGGNP